MPRQHSHGQKHLHSAAAGRRADFVDAAGGEPDKRAMREPPALPGENSVRHRLQGIEACRGFAAVLVVFYHAGKMISLPQYYNYTPFGNFFSFGHAGVDFFFVLSGFIITYVHRRDLGRPVALGQFCYRRFVRIFPLYWIVTAIVFVLALFSPDRAARLAPGHLIASLLLLPHSQDPLLGVGWTLEHEMLFYLAFAVAIVSKRLGLALAAAGAGLAVAGSLVRFGFPLDFLTTPYHLQFMMGVAAAMAVGSGRVAAPGVLAAAGTLGFFATGLTENAGLLTWAGPASILLFGACSMLVITGIATLEQRGQLTVGAAGRLLGGASYAIYLFHTIAIGLLVHAGAELGLLRWIPGWLMLLTGAVVAIGASVVLHIVVERPLMARLRRGGALPRTPAGLRPAPTKGQGPLEPNT